MMKYKIILPIKDMMKNEIKNTSQTQKYLIRVLSSIRKNCSLNLANFYRQFG